jgi:hypothetical protein
MSPTERALDGPAIVPIHAMRQIKSGPLLTSGVEFKMLWKRGERQADFHQTKVQVVTLPAFCTATG